MQASGQEVYVPKYAIRREGDEQEKTQSHDQQEQQARGLHESQHTPGAALALPLSIRVAQLDSAVSQAEQLRDQQVQKQ
jgi:hypothetical protein